MKKLTERNVFIESFQGDTLTPISIYQRLSGRKKFLLESSLKHEDSGRYSFIGANPTYELKGSLGRTIISGEQKEEVVYDSPLNVLKRLLPDLGDIDIGIPFVGGAVGFVGYDVVRHYEEIGEVPFDEMELPDIHFLIFEEVVIYDHLEQRVYVAGLPLVETTTEEQIRRRLEQRKKEIFLRIEDGQEPVKLSSFQASISKEQFIENVKRAKEYIVEGDIFQVVLSQRMKAKIEGDPFTFYRKLRIQNPSPYMYYLDFDEYIVAGASPESLIKVANNRIITNPIAGTRPRGSTEEEDGRLTAQLLSDEKELAEHQMLVDLGRNDLGRVSEFGTIQIDKYMEIEKYKHVMHIVSEVSGVLKPQYSPIDALIACLPAGTVSGAPKIRAMEIINKLEDVKRGVYSGAIGYFSANGHMDFALAIRTMVLKGEEVYIQAGAGIVYDSIPEKEYDETLHKLRAFLEEEK